MTAVEQRSVLEPAAPDLTEATAGPRGLADLRPSGAHATRAAIAQATAFLRAALGTE